MVDVTSYSIASTTAGTNASINGTSILGTGLVSTADDSFRNSMALAAKFYSDFGGTGTVGGSANAITITTPTVYLVLATGMRIRFTPGSTNTAATTLNLDAIGAKAVRKVSGSGTDIALVGGELQIGVPVDIVYSAAANSAAGGWIIGGAGIPSGRNRVVNPAMQVSQENGNTAVTGASSYAADAFFTAFVTSAGTFTSQRVQSTTPNGSKDRYRTTITVADASLAAGEYLFIATNLEGQEVADLQYGAATALQSIVRFGFKGPAGTYAMRIGNGANTRSYVALFTISAGQANADTVQTFVVPGDTTGTWLKDTGIGLALDIVLACGSTFQGATGWQAGSILGTSGVSNGVGTGAAVFELFDVGFYADPLLTGSAPVWEIPNYAQEFMKCQRQLQVFGGDLALQYLGSGMNFSTTQAQCFVPLEVPMRIVPTVTFSAVANFAVLNNAAALVQTTVLATASQASTGTVEITVSVAAGLVQGNATQFLTNNTLSARMVVNAKL